MSRKRKPPRPTVTAPRASRSAGQVVDGPDVEGSVAEGQAVAGRAVIALDRQDVLDLLAQREPLFSIGETEYTIPVEVPASVTTRAVEIAMQQGELASLQYAIDFALDAEAQRALFECPTLTKADLNAVTRIIAERVVPKGASTSPKASPPPTTGETASPT